MISAWWSICLTEWRLQWRNRHQLINGLVFFMLVALLFSLTSGPVAQSTTASVIWLAVLLSSLNSLERCFSHEVADQALEQLLLSPISLTTLVAAKLAAQLLTIMLPLLLSSLLLSWASGWSGHAIGILMATLVLGLPIVYALGALLTALTLGLQQRGLLLTVLLLPLIVPVLIAAIGAISQLNQSGVLHAQLALLAAGCVLVCSGVSWAVAAILPWSLEH